jgi:hypothetical protein
MEYLRIAPDIDADPDLMEVGWVGVRVFELLLKVAAAKDFRGRIPPSYQRLSWLARFWNLNPDDLPGTTPELFIQAGVARLVAVGGWVTVGGDGAWQLRAWEKFYKPAKTDAERQAEKRLRDAAKADTELGGGRDAAPALPSPVPVTPITPVTDHRDARDCHATPHHTTPLHVTEATAAAGAAAQEPLALEPTAPTATPAEQLKATWNELTTAPLPRWGHTGKDRSTLAANALKRRPLAEWREVFKRIDASSFCRGEGDKGWIADPDWALRSGSRRKPEPAAKVLEGTYDDREPAASRGAAHIVQPPPRPVLPTMPDSPAGRLWGSALARIDADGKASALEWLAKVRPVALSGDVLVLEAQDRFCVNWIEDHYLAFLAETLTAISGSKTTAALRLRPSEAA